MGRWYRRVVPLVLVPALLALAGCTRFGGTLNRPEDPVVLDGSGLPKLLGTAPAHVVGFAWDGSQWHQIPVQVDERDLVNPGQILNRPSNIWPTLSGTSTPFKILVYTPPANPGPGYTSWDTYTPHDSDPTFDANDQVSLLANDTGKQAGAGAGAPTGVDASTVEQVTVSDPLGSGGVGYAYLYRSATLTGGGAGTTGVQYTFSLDSGDYKATYKMGTASNAPNNVNGPNPEQSVVQTPTYRLTYGDRWLNDGLSITTGGAATTDVLERGRAQVTGAGCARTEDSFDEVWSALPYEAGFIVNVSGPVRAIRSHIGTNSGTYTVLTDVFYPQREDSTTDLRVHPIPGVAVFDDFTTGLTGLKYSDDQTNGVPIDGVPDAVATAHVPQWQMVSGTPGSIVTARTAPNIAGLVASTYYLDQRPANPLPCTGDDTAWGQNGEQVLGPGGGALPCTDPTICAGAIPLTSTRFRYYEGPNLSRSTAATLAQHAQTPVQVSVSG